MSGSLLGRGRGGRLAVYAGSASVIVLLIFVYRAAITEMARLRDLHEQCALNQESLQQQLQVIFEYKVRLEKSLADETSANAAVKQELQQRATMEKSQLDKVTMEATNRYNSLHQDYKILQTEHKDLEEECDRRKKQASENSTRLESMLQELRTELNQARDDKRQSLENLKNKYLQVNTEKSAIEQKYNDLLKTNGDANIDNQRLQKQVFQLNRELEAAKSTCGSDRAPSISSPGEGVAAEAGENVRAAASRVAGSQNAINRPPPQSQQQGSSTTISKSQTTRAVEVLPKASIKPSTQSSEKIIAERAKVRLPVGVLPIPRMFEAEKKSAVPGEGDKNDKNRASDTGKLPLADKDKLSFDGRELNPVDPPRLPPAGRHAGDQPGRQDARAWQNQVPPGVQEVGEEPNNLEKIPGLEDTGNHPVREGEEYGQYEGGDYDKESPMRSNDLPIEEGEDEGEDEDDIMEYEGANLKPDKHPE